MDETEYKMMTNFIVRANCVNKLNLVIICIADSCLLNVHFKS
jgi:hypothetical protein